jgi:formylglycine-generating enzyme required for sulfatase activity
MVLANIWFLILSNRPRRGKESHMKTTQIWTLALVAIAFSGPNALAAYNWFTYRHGANPFEGPAVSHDVVAYTSQPSDNKGSISPASIGVFHGDFRPVGVYVGSVAPSGTFTNFGPARVSAFSTVGISGDFNNNGAVDAVDYVLWRNGGLLQNDPTPGVQSEDYDTWRANFGQVGDVAAAYTVAFHGTYDNPPKSGIFAKRGGQLTTIAKVGDSMPSTGSPIVHVYPDLAISGSTVVFGATDAGGTSAILMASGGALTTVAKTGDMTSLGPLESLVPSPAISGNSVAFAATAGDGTRGIFASSGGELTTIFKVGDPAPVGVFTSFFQEGISMGTDGKVTFLANYDLGTRSGIFTAGGGGELTTVVKTGDVLPGVGASYLLGGPSMAGDEVAFYALVSGGPSAPYPQSTFFLRKGSEPIQRIASVAELPGTSGGSPASIGMGRFGFSGYRLAFSFDIQINKGVGIIAVRTIPEPASWLLTSLAGLALLGTCRRRNTQSTRCYVSLLCAITLLGVAARVEAGTLYAATAGDHGELYILDPNTGGVLRDIGPLNDATGRNYPMEALAFQPHTHVLYGATHYSDPADPATVSKLVTINTETAEVTVVGSFFLGNPGTMTDIAFPLTGGLSGISSYGPPQVHYIDLATGITTPSGLIGDFPATVGGGIATMGGGGILGGFAETMYFVTPTADELGVHGHACAPRFGCAFQYRTISNPAKPAGGGFYSALDFDGEVLYGLNVGAGSPPRTHLVRINTTTGAVTDIGRSVDGLAAIAFVPEPGTLALSAACLAALFVWMSRRLSRSLLAQVGSRSVALLLIAGTCVCLAPQPAMAVTIHWVTVADPGNPPWNGYLGSVPYVYRIGKYDVTVSQYVEFLNHKDPTGANTLDLYGPEMSDSTYGGISFNADGADGSKYEVIAGRGNHPVNYVTWYDAVRFANWLHNGQRDGDTENGAYTLLGGTPTPSNGPSITRNTGAIVFLPSHDEWVKAGYYLPGTNTYFTYPTATNTRPIASPPTDVINRANYGPNGAGNLTDVGAYTRTTSPYGAFDTIGNVVQWVDSEYVGPGGIAPYRHFLGTAFYYPDYPGALYGQIGQPGGNIATLVDRGTGFRVASIIPEPSAGTLVLLGCGLMWWSRRWRKARFPGSFASFLCAIAMFAVAARRGL